MYMCEGGYRSVSCNQHCIDVNAWWCDESMIIICSYQVEWDRDSSSDIRLLERSVSLLESGNIGLLEDY